MKLYIIRHAESEGNATGEYGTAVSDSLSSKGQKQAHALADELQDFDFDQIIVSPRLRTMQTIAPYLKKTKHNGELWPELAEACWHEEREEAAKSWPRIPYQFTEEEKEIFRFRDNEAIVPGDPETFGEGLLRVHETLKKIMRTQEDSILMVTHGHFTREFLNLILDTGKTVVFHKENCGMTLITFDNGWSMEFFNRPMVKV